MTKIKKLEYRMYGLVPYNISEIQKGIQFGHAVVEYANLHSKDKDYKQWSTQDKTFIILNGGTTNEGLVPIDSNAFKRHKSTTNLGTMQKHYLALEEAGIKFAFFREPDLNNTMTAIVFLVDERVFNKERNPDFDENHMNYHLWAKSIGSAQNIFLRDFLKQFRLA